MNHTTCVFEEAANAPIWVSTVNVEWISLIGILRILVTEMCVWAILISTSILGTRMEDAVEKV
jgi:hypothetical protein